MSKAVFNVEKNVPRDAGKILSANRLDDGLSVFLAADGSWSRDINDALMALNDDEIAALEAKGEEDVARNLVNEPYVVSARREGGRIEPIHFRERIRALGSPTIPIPAERRA